MNTNSKEFKIDKLSDLPINVSTEAYRNGNRILALVLQSITLPTSMTVVVGTTSNAIPIICRDASGVVACPSVASWLNSGYGILQIDSSGGLNNTKITGLTVGQGTVRCYASNVQSTDMIVNVVEQSVNNYGCVGDQCLQGYGDLPVGCYNTCTGTTTQKCPGCDTSANYCIMGSCIPKNYLLIAGVGVAALLTLK